MDDGTINVLRRSGSWKKVSLRQDNLDHNTSLSNNDVISNNIEKINNKADIENINIIANSIKRNIKNELLEKKTSHNSQSKYTTTNPSIEPVNKTISKKSKQLLPLLRKLDLLAEQRTSLGQNITAIDIELSKIIKDIENIKISCQNDIDKIKSHMKLYDNSLSVIYKLKGDLNYGSE